MRSTVAVVGGGIAGSAACLALSNLGIPTCLVAPDETSPEKPGESLAAAAVSLLEQLGLSDLLADPAHRRAHASFTSWGSAALLERHAAAQRDGLGHVVDRTRLESALVAAVKCRQGLHLVAGRLRHARRTAAGWQLDIDTGQRISTRFLVDATGRRAEVGRRLSGLRRLDRLIAAYAFLRQVDPDIDPTPATLIEAVPCGWWYATLLADRRLVVQFYSDPDLMPRGLGRDVTAWKELAAGTSYIARWIETAGFELSQPPRLTSAGTAWLETAAGPDWIAVGDAAASFDPLSAHGMTTALWTGVEAARTLSLASQGDVGATAHYAARVRSGIERFSLERNAIYSREVRFADKPFWRRRHGSLAGKASSTTRRQPVLA
jgi:2-polyprenyl-6-methoxyphenol hydroxylase-like FAD-dependent oxidoreductase